ncbi:MAG: Flp family type IVb pilin [Myxococcota bacterium]
MAHIIRFLDDEGGATAIEYGMLCSLCILTILAAVTQFADSTIDLWTTVAAHV